MKKHIVRFLVASMIFSFGFVGMVVYDNATQEVKPKEATLESISVTTTPTKVTYKKGETFKRDGMVVNEGRNVSQIVDKSEYTNYLGNLSFINLDFANVGFGK